jgi:hypothetical protein
MPGRQCGMAKEFTEKLTEKVRKYVFFYDTGHPDRNLVQKASLWFRASTTVSFFF